jgi:hypothetical protein
MKDSFYTHETSDMQQNAKIQYYNISAKLLSHLNHNRQWTKITQLYLASMCGIWDFHSGDYEECHLLECDAIELVGTNVLEEHVASIFRAEEIREQETALTFN